jgi:hypothetical protein
MRQTPTEPLLRLTALVWIVPGWALVAVLFLSVSQAWKVAAGVGVLLWGIATALVGLRLRRRRHQHVIDHRG